MPSTTATKHISESARRHDHAGHHNHHRSHGDPHAKFDESVMKPTYAGTPCGVLCGRAALAAAAIEAINAHEHSRAVAAGCSPPPPLTTHDDLVAWLNAHDGAGAHETQLDYARGPAHPGCRVFLGCLSHVVGAFDVRLLCAIADPSVRVTRVSLDVQKDDPSRRTGVARVWAATPAEASALIRLLRDGVYTDHDTFIVALGASEEARAAGRESLKALGGKLRAWFAAKRGRTDRPTALVNVQLENHHPRR